MILLKSVGTQSGASLFLLSLLFLCLHPDKTTEFEQYPLYALHGIQEPIRCNVSVG
uniref:AlNc14C20G2064 protein n=1 Tax=Albugo laibachii Nc14 TaxID=890382 RepID=F0W598_9STRA|nr:AlNc14C20G2064 [Albugo laibachii Nc14]|eukprot:CCA16289.1 AlNc14C20G2064 [Albugo laibachii Nc14]